ncbi:putative membrane-associated phospholipid phosphatase [Aliivibrio wodanis]|uniref:undecaprenyl-diphosphate phosphatase n=1 Tax=Aliivibrio wodanis TaxID=80852 RepID=A0A090ILQ1_9GAMM|nr:putative membrane-associated phospholipid phosphatase [Aliivibrio wodanis]VVV04375.1 hypothetical protein AW0309160_01759 [Aliivibrio wodanis]
MNKIFTLCLLLSSFATSFLSIPALADQEVTSKGAVCVVDDGFRVVLIEELITGKLSLPGGLIDVGETPQQAAERETWEEAGLVVTAKEQLYKDDKATFFRCVSDSEIVVFDLQTNDGLFRIPSWFSPHYGIETEAVYLSEPYKITPEQYRYPQQLTLLQHWFAKPLDSDNQITWVTDLIGQASDIHQAELGLLMSLRESINSLPTVINTSIKIFFTIINETGTEAFFYFLFIVGLVYFGRGTALTLLFGIVLTIIFTELAKLGLALPRPFVYVPQLQLTQANGFGMPSMSAMLATVIYGVFYLALKKRDLAPALLNRFVLFFVGLIITQSIAQVWLGIHFLTDAIVGIALGAMVIVHFSNLQKKHGDLLYRVIESIQFWLIIAIISSGIAFTMQYMNYLYMAAICWGVVLAILISKGVVIKSLKTRVITLLTLFVVILLTRYGVSVLLDLLESSSLIVLMVKAIANFSLIFVIIVLATWLPCRLESKKA